MCCKTLAFSKGCGITLAQYKRFVRWRSRSSVMDGLERKCNDERKLSGQFTFLDLACDCFIRILKFLSLFLASGRHSWSQARLCWHNKWPCFIAWSVWMPLGWWIISFRSVLYTQFLFVRSRFYRKWPFHSVDYYPSLYSIIPCIERHLNIGND